MDLAYNKWRVNDLHDGFMRNPLLHRLHRNGVNFVPKLHLLVIEVLIIDEGALELEPIGKDDSSIFIQIQIPGLNHPIKHAIIVHTEPHGLTYDHINLCIEILPTEHFNHSLQPILLHNLPHHPHILLLRQRVPINNTINLRRTCLCRIYRVVTITTWC